MIFYEFLESLAKAFAEQSFTARDVEVKFYHYDLHRRSSLAHTQMDLNRVWKMSLLRRKKIRAYRRGRKKFQYWITKKGFRYLKWRKSWYKCPECDRIFFPSLSSWRIQQCRSCGYTLKRPPYRGPYIEDPVMALQKLKTQSAEQKLEQIEKEKTDTAKEHNNKILAVNQAQKHHSVILRTIREGKLSAADIERYLSGLWFLLSSTIVQGHMPALPAIVALTQIQESVINRAT